MTIHAPHEMRLLLKDWLILIADDDPPSRALFARVLRYYNALPIMAEDGQQALAILKNGNERPHVILTDLSMPHMDGWQLYAAIRTLANMDDVPIIATTANVMERDRDRVVMTGFSGHIIKPFNVTTLPMTIFDMVSKWHAARNAQRLADSLKLPGESIEIYPSEALT